MFLDVWCSWARAGALGKHAVESMTCRIVHRVRNPDTSFSRAASGAWNAVQVQVAELTSLEKLLSITVLH